MPDSKKELNKRQLEIELDKKQRELEEISKTRINLVEAKNINAFLVPIVLIIAIVILTHLIGPFAAIIGALLGTTAYGASYIVKVLNNKKAYKNKLKEIVDLEEKLDYETIKEETIYLSLAQKKLLKEVLEDYDLNKIFETIYDNDLDYETVINDVKDIINTHIKASTKQSNKVEEIVSEELQEEPIYVDDSKDLGKSPIINKKK